MDLAVNFIDCLSIIFLLKKKNYSAFSNTELILAGGYMNGTMSNVVEKYNIQTGKGNFTIFLFYTPMLPSHRSRYCTWTR